MGWAVSLFLPHEVGWRRVAPRAASAAGVEGHDHGAPAVIPAMLDPIAPSVAETRYGLRGTDRAYLVFLDPADAPDVREGDVLAWEGMDLTVRSARVYDVGDGFAHVEAVASAVARGR